MFEKYLASGDIEPLITYPDNLVERNMGVQYYKTAMVLLCYEAVFLVKKCLMMRSNNIKRWAYKHPAL